MSSATVEASEQNNEMPIEVKQMTIQSNVTSQPNNTVEKEQSFCPQGNKEMDRSLQPHSEQFQAIKQMYQKLHQERRER